jgi:hypothetical protein
VLSARRKSDGKTVTAYFASKANGPFICQDCNEEVILKTGRSKVNHFAHANPISCRFATGESDEHRRCKLEIFRAAGDELKGFGFHSGGTSTGFPGAINSNLEESSLLRFQRW